MSGPTVRTLGWPLEPGTAPKIAELVEHLAAEMEAAMPASEPGCALVEVGADEEGGVLRLAERLAAAWTARGRACVVVDAHPVAPFTEGCFEEGAEGFTEILHYGLSPEAAAREREGATGLWIPAGGRWALPLESPDEPALALYRLGHLAERVLLLAAAGDDEGLLPALRQHSRYRLVLVPPSAPADALPAAARSAAESAPEAEPGPEPETERGAGPARAFGGAAPEAAAGGRGRRRLWLWLPLLLVVLLAALWALRGGSGGGGEDLAAGGAEQEPGFSPLPAPAELPYSSGQNAESADENELPEVASERTPAPEPVPESAPPARSEESPPPAAGTAAASAAPAAAAPRRRFETHARWEALLAHSGDFYVHVESYLDPDLAASSARERGFDRPGFKLEPAVVDGTTYHRLLVGPFGDLVTATAFRDSLLDQTDETYCTVARGDTR